VGQESYNVEVFKANLETLEQVTLRTYLDYVVEDLDVALDH
jgi:hypothetical protein